MSAALRAKTGTGIDCVVVAPSESQTFTVTVTTVDGQQVQPQLLNRPRAIQPSDGRSENRCCTAPAASSIIARMARSRLPHRFAVEHRDPPIPEPVPPKVPRWLVTALSAGHAGALARNDGFEPVGLAWTLRWV